MIPAEYPRPNMYRKSWRSLDGWWEFDFYDDYFVLSPREKIDGNLHHTIQVPFTYQTSISGIGTADIHERVIYRRTVRLKDKERESRIILHFGAVDFNAEVWIDNTVVGSHKGGYTPFFFDITAFTKEKQEIVLSLIVEDRPTPAQPRGKQAPGTPFDCWYTAVTGIWQSVWLEFLPDIYFSKFSAVQNAKNGSVNYKLNISSPGENCCIEAEIRFNGESVAHMKSECSYPCTEVNLTVPEFQSWSPEAPNLYTVHFYLVRNETVIDEVETYFSFREVGLKSDGLYINKKRYFQKLVLMQGFWQESGYTAPSIDSYEKDIRRAKEMGFNGCRMHMKFEDPRFLYAADRLGFLVWAEAPSFYAFTDESCSVFRKELIDILKRDLLHPSVITWVLGNESWGMRDINESEKIRSWLNEIKELTRRIDPTRPIICNDGWEHLNSDIMTFHSYEHSEKALKDDWYRARRNERCGILKKHFDLTGKNILALPWVLSEFGAISLLRQREGSEHWGYGDVATSEEDLLHRFERLIQDASSLDGISGWCYTQFSDIEQEKNGLLFEDRTPKIKPSAIKKILDNN
ncbi:MAG: glycoside hydrolase family 2 TIM barrel-domain containing protein [Spirochaetia bacterium]